jgi:hypothetical protein
VAYIAVILTSWSYLLVHYGTEARGYSLVIFFALLAWYALQQFEDRGDERGRCVRSSPLQAATTASRLPNCVNAEIRARSWIWIVVFWGAVVLGFLSHLEFAICFAGLVAWALWRCVRYRSTWRRAVLDLIALFTVPIILLLVFYFVSIRGMEVGAGPPYRLWPLLIKTASYMVGGPASGGAAGIAALVAVVSIYFVLTYLMFERDDRWIFYAVVIILPLGLIAILLPVSLSVRYFMISVAASLLLLCSGFAALLGRRVEGSYIALTLLLAFVAGNAVNTSNLLRFGRGQYVAALRFMEKNSDGREVVITSDHDFRNAMLVNYYKRHLARPDLIRYATAETLSEHGADWLILHRFELTRWTDRVTDAYGNAYQLVKIYKYSDNSGWNWLLYHNLNRSLVPPQSPLLQ